MVASLRGLLRPTENMPKGPQIYGLKTTSLAHSIFGIVGMLFLGGMWYKHHKKNKQRELQAAAVSEEEMTRMLRLLEAKLQENPNPDSVASNPKNVNKN